MYAKFCLFFASQINFSHRLWKLRWICIEEYYYRTTMRKYVCSEWLNYIQTYRKLFHFVGDSMGPWFCFVVVFVCLFVFRSLLEISEAKKPKQKKLRLFRMPFLVFTVCVLCSFSVSLMVSDQKGGRLMWHHTNNRKVFDYKDYIYCSNKNNWSFL